MTDSTPVEPFLALSVVLDGLGIAQSPAEYHGRLSGYLVVLGVRGTLTREDAEVWVTGMIEQAGVSDEMLSAPAGSEAAARLEESLAGLETTWYATLEALRSDSYEFALWLPADDTPIGRRTRSLGEWCSGFLSGLGEGGLDAQGLPESVMEVLGDFADLTRIEPSPEAGESSEAAFAELVEYVKVGVLVVQEELRAAGMPSSESRTLH